MAETQALAAQKMRLIDQEALRRCNSWTNHRGPGVVRLLYITRNNVGKSKNASRRTRYSVT